MHHIIYKITNMINGKSYIGAHSTENPLDSYMGSGKALRAAMKKYGNQNFYKTVLYEASTKKEMYDKEQELVILGPTSYNLVPGGLGGDKISSLTEDQKISHKLKSGEASKRMWDSMPTEKREQYKHRLIKTNKNINRSYMIERNKRLCAKTAIIIHPSGKKETVTNVAEFAQIHNLNYGNLKSVLRGNGVRTSCSGFRGYYAD